MACARDYAYDKCPYSPCPSGYCEYKVDCEPNHRLDIAMQIADVLVRWKDELEHYKLQDLFDSATLFYIHRR